MIAGLNQQASVITSRMTFLGVSALAGVLTLAFSDSARSTSEALAACASEIHAAAGGSSPGSDEPVKIMITGRNRQWYVQYPGGSGRPAGGEQGQPADEVHVPQNANIILTLNSDDYLYVLALPQYGLKEIAVPDLTFRIQFRSAEAGRFDLTADELCGDLRPKWKGHLVVEPREQFVQWLKNRGPASPR